MAILDINTNSISNGVQFFALNEFQNLITGVWCEWERYQNGVWSPLQSGLSLSAIDVFETPVVVGGLELPASVTVRARHFDTVDTSGTPTTWSRYCVGRTGAQDALYWDVVTSQVQFGNSDVVFSSQGIPSDSTLIVLISPLAGGNLGTIASDFSNGAFPQWQLLHSRGGTILAKSIAPVADGTGVVPLPSAWSPYLKNVVIAPAVSGYSIQIDFADTDIPPSSSYSLLPFTSLNNAYDYAGVLYTFAHTVSGTFIGPEFEDNYPFGENEFTGSSFGGQINGALMGLYMLGTDVETPLLPLPNPINVLTAISGVIDIYLVSQTTPPVPPPSGIPSVVLEDSVFTIRDASQNTLINLPIEFNPGRPTPSARIEVNEIATSSRVYYTGDGLPDSGADYRLVARIDEKRYPNLISDIRIAMQSMAFLVYTKPIDDLYLQIDTTLERRGFIIETNDERVWFTEVELVFNCHTPSWRRTSTGEEVGTVV